MQVKEMPHLNFDPILQKIKNNLDKGNKIRLTLWGRVNVIKMVVSPQFHYPLMMHPPPFFNQYDTLVKKFLWEGKRPRIKLTKLC